MLRATREPHYVQVCWFSHVACDEVARYYAPVLLVVHVNNNNNNNNAIASAAM